MAKLLFRLGKWSYLHKWTVVITWLLIVSSLAGAVAAFSKDFMDRFSIPGMPSATASQMIEQKFPDEPNPIRQLFVYLVFEAPDGETLDQPQNMEAMDEVITYIRDNVGQLGDTSQLENPVRLNPIFQDMIATQGEESGLPSDVAKADAQTLRTLSEDRRIGIATFDFDAFVQADIDPVNHEQLEVAMDIGRDAGLKVEAMGQGMQPAIAMAPVSEIVGVSVALVILIITFGSLAAAFFPIATALVGISIGGMTVILSTAWTDVNSITPVMAIMFGLAVGIDYALFILSRVRSERAKGLAMPDAVGMATGTAGSSVVFAGLTVIIALVALLVAQIPFLSLMGLSAAFTVAVAVMVSLTLLPAIMSFFGDKVFGLKIPGLAGNPGGWRAKWRTRRKASKAGNAGVGNAGAGNAPQATPAAPTDTAGNKMTLGRRWILLVHRAPAAFLIGVILILVALAIPASRLDLALPSDSTAEFETTNRKAIAMAEEGFGPGRNSQLILIANGDNVDPQAPAIQPLLDNVRQNNPDATELQVAQKAAYAYALDQFKSNMGVEHVQMIGINGDGSAVKMLMTPASGPLDAETKQLMTALRQQQNQIEATTGLYVGVTGLVPIEIDITDRLSHAMPIYLSVVVGLAIILLLLVFRSILVPLTAGLGFLISVGAAFGVTVLFFQEGLWGLVGTPGPLVSFIPIFLIGVTFGLAMDYQVFMVSRMREHYTHMKGKPSPGSPYSGVDESVIEGFAQGARVITAAAIIMISVFVAFVGQPLAFIRVFGFALGAGVLFDAFLIRMTMIPASMFLLGRATWWIPGWLNRILPSVDVEGAALEKREHELVAAGAGTVRAKVSEKPVAQQQAPASVASPTLIDQPDAANPAAESVPETKLVQQPKQQQQQQPKQQPPKQPHPGQLEQVPYRPPVRRRKKITVDELLRREGADDEIRPRRRRGVWDPAESEYVDYGQQPNQPNRPNPPHHPQQPNQVNRVESQRLDRQPNRQPDQKPEDS